MRTRGTLLFFAGLAVSLAAGWLAFPRALYREQAQPVEFSHIKHTEKAGMLCEDCHTLRTDGSYTGVPSLKQCSGCHQQNLGPSQAEREFIARYVKPNRQPDWVLYSRQPENVWFSHTPHVTTGKLKCEECHGDQGTNDAPRIYRVDRISGYPYGILSMDECIACHEQKGLAHSCLDCHK